MATTTLHKSQPDVGPFLVNPTHNTDLVSSQYLVLLLLSVTFSALA
jgi:hypothetical protein